MAITPLPLPTPAGVVADAGARIAELDEVMWAARSDSDLVGTVEEVQVLRAQLAALEAVVLAEVDARDLAKQCLGWGSTGDWYTHLAGVRRGQGRRVVDQARQLAGDRSATLSALREGAISPDQAGVVLDAVDRLPSRTGSATAANGCCWRKPSGSTPPTWPGPDGTWPRSSTPTGTERETERALDRDDRAAHLGRFLSVTEDGIGGVRVKGRGTAEDGARLRAALLPLTAPVPGRRSRHLRGAPRPPRPRRPHVGRPGPDRRARPGPPTYPPTLTAPALG